VTIAIIVVSVLPAVIAFLRRKKAEPDAAA
jgi:hypothetical protein